MSGWVLLVKSHSWLTVYSYVNQLYLPDTHYIWEICTVYQDLLQVKNGRQQRWRVRDEICQDISSKGEELRNSQPASFLGSVQFSSVAQLCLTLCNPMDCSMPGFPVHHQLPEPTQTHVHWVSDTIQPSHPLLSPSPPAFNLSQHQGLFQWVSSSHQVAKVLEFQLQHQSFQCMFRTDFR